MTRQYRMAKRAAAQEDTRERIIQATVTLHDEQGIALTSFSDVASRAGVGAATVFRHFPDINALVAACGRHVAAEMAPPGPEDAPALFAGLVSSRERLERLVRELHAFYERGRMRLEKAEQDRTRIEALDRFLAGLDANRRALLGAAMEPDNPDGALISALMALSGMDVWASLRDGGFSAGAAVAFHAAILGRASEALAESRQG